MTPTEYPIFPMFAQQASQTFITDALAFADYIWAFGIFAEEEMPIEPEGFRAEDWGNYHNELVDMLSALNNRVKPEMDIDEYFAREDMARIGELSDEEVHPMYCRWCGAEYGEEWAQCECHTELEIES